MKKNLFFLSLIIILCISCASPNANMKSQTSSFEILKKSNYGGCEKTQEMWATSETEFNELWLQLHQYQTPTPELPAIDWEKHSVLALCFGQFSNGGFKSEIKSVQQENDSLVVSIFYPKQDPLAPVTMAITNPYTILKINKTKPIPVKRKAISAE